MQTCDRERERKRERKGERERERKRERERERGEREREREREYADQHIECTPERDCAWGRGGERESMRTGI